VSDRTQRLLLFLYGNRNIAGSVLGIVGLGLFFAGLTPHLWYLIVAGLYGIGYLAAPSGSQVDLSLGTELTQDAIAARLAGLVATVSRRAEPDVVTVVQSIRDSIVALLPRLLPRVGSPDPNLYVVRQTATDYLPATLQNYLSLPPAFRRLHPLRDGKTAHTVLIEQLTLLDEKMKETLVSVTENDTQALLTNGRFLKERFASGADFLTVDSGAH
jgi:hypothetical protein